jgi:hypothetical protein
MLTLAVNGKVRATLTREDALAVVACFRENVQWQLSDDNGVIATNETPLA